MSKNPEITNLNFDYNIENYNHEELCNILNLETDYTIEMVEKNEMKMKKRISNNKKISEKTKQDIFDFLKKVKSTLTNSLVVPSSIISSGFIVPSGVSSELVPAMTQAYTTASASSTTITDIYNTDKEMQISKLSSAGDTFILNRDHKPYNRSYPIEYAQSNLNPLEKRTIDKNLTIDTRFRTNYYTTLSTNYIIDLPIVFKNVVSMNLDTVEFPTTFFEENQLYQSNYFSIIINDVIQTITVPTGNYASADIIYYLNTFMSSLSSPFSDIVFTYNIAGSNSGSGQMVIGIKSGVTPFNFTLDFQANENGIPDHTTPLPLKLGWSMGFRCGIYENNSTYVSEGIMDLIGRRYVFLAIDEFCSNKSDTFYSAYTNSLLNKNILARISISGSNFVYQSQPNISSITNKRYYFGPVDIQKLHIQLLDEYGRVINLNNMDFSFSLSLTTIYNI